MKLVPTETGQLTMTKQKNNTQESKNTLSILICQDGFSFCVKSKETIISFEKINLSASNYANELLIHFQEKINAAFIEEQNIGDLKLTYENDNFSLVPNAFFDKDKISHYIKYSTPILDNDFYAFDTIETIATTNVFIPFVHINNYLFDLFGDFEYQHHLSLLIDSFFVKGNYQASCYVLITDNYLNLLCFNDAKLKLANVYKYQSEEDIAYYILFALEQLVFERENLVLYINQQESQKLIELIQAYISEIKTLKLEDFAPDYLNTASITKDFNEILLLNL